MKLAELVTETVKDLPANLLKQYEERAAAERKAGGKIDIDTGLPSISIKMSDDSEYDFQEHEADKLLDGVPSNIDAEDFILAQAQNW